MSKANKYVKKDNVPQEQEKDELWLINRWEEHNKMQLANTRKNLKLLMLEEKLIHNIKKKWKS